MRYFFLIIASICFSVTINAQNVPNNKVQKSEKIIPEQTLALSKKALTTSLERYKEAVSIQDSQSQNELKEEILSLMNQVVSNNSSVSKAAKTNRLQASERKEKNTQQKVLYNQAIKAENGIQFETIVTDFLEKI